MSLSFIDAGALLHRAIAEGAFPSAVAEVGTATGPLWQEAFGTLSYDDSTPAGLDTIYDLASLTKVLATTPLVMRAVETGAMALDDTVSTYVPAWTGSERHSVTVRDLLSHSSGLPAHHPFYRDHQGRDAIEQAICRTPLEYKPGTRSIYSDLGIHAARFHALAWNIAREPLRRPEGHHGEPAGPAVSATIVMASAHRAGARRPLARKGSHR